MAEPERSTGSVAAPAGKQERHGRRLHPGHLLAEKRKSICESVLEIPLGQRNSLKALEDYRGRPIECYARQWPRVRRHKNSVAHRAVM